MPIPTSAVEQAPLRSYKQMNSRLVFQRHSTEASPAVRPRKSSGPECDARAGAVEPAAARNRTADHCRASRAEQFATSRQHEVARRTDMHRKLVLFFGWSVLAAVMLLSLARPAVAQDTWQGTIGAWSVASNWTKGVPNGTTPIFINTGTVDGDTSFTNQQALSIGTAVQLNIDSTTDILSKGTDAAINNSGGLTNNGDLTFELGATLNNASTGLLVNNGLITMVNVSQFNNAGDLINERGLDLDSTFNSTGSLDNFGGIDVSGNTSITGSFTNQAGGTLTNFSSGRITIDSAFTTFNNGTFTNLAGGQITTSSDFSNTGTLDNSGSLTSDTIENSSTGTIDNSGDALVLLTLTNSGTVNNTAGTLGLFTL